ncbi:beta/gamma crystallin domain-containing protein [Peribacillus sp. NJ4]|uniref:beta/gamma crystallin domain-containing protein n=1 Tax=Peribacillus sp. NJ4 TaxID=3055862 RepID=UPI0025A0BD05|nr:beta/gamma crystallin domain-containing protein [Peribacillus sp. NJ4]MDM5215064.1 beta/gamma crystallin domain-containing protein [Peribacillus sp. NJ4]
MFYNPYGDDLTVRVPVNTFYQYVNGSGRSFTMNSGEFMEYLGEQWNDRISSVRVAPRTLVVLYQRANFTGKKKILENLGDSPYLFNSIHTEGDANISSIKTYRLIR